MSGTIEFTIAALKTTEGIGFTLNPKIDVFKFDKKGKVKESLEYIDLIISDMQRAKKSLSSSVSEIKNYSRKKAIIKTLKDLHEQEDLIEILLNEARKIKPESEKEKIFLDEFKNFCNEVIGIVGLLEVMAMVPSQRDAILNHSGKASLGSKEFNIKDFQ